MDIFASPSLRIISLKTLDTERLLSNHEWEWDQKQPSPPWKLKKLLSPSPSLYYIYFFTYVVVFLFPPLSVWRGIVLVVSVTLLNDSTSSLLIPLLYYFFDWAQSVCCRYSVLLRASRR